MDHYLFFFGRTPGLSLAELRAFIPTAELFDEHTGSVKGTSVRIDGVVRPMENLIAYLGGTIKIARVVSEPSVITQSELVGHIDSETEKECVFALTSLTSRWIPDQSILRAIKDELSHKYPKVRYLISRHESGVSNVAIKKERAVELTVLEKGETFVIARTVSIQNVDVWAQREYDRPYADAKAGMLPVKVARMVVNIGLGTEAKSKVLLDPFCGMGTILGETAERQASALGSDIDEEVVRKANGNLRWLLKAFGYTTKVEIVKADAVHASERLVPNSIDAIVTEPFLGSTKLGEGKITQREDIKNIVKGLAKLYKGCLKDWHTILKPGGKIVMAFPSIMKETSVYSPVKSIIDSCEILGYTKLLGPLSYHRPDAIVRREFFVFEKK